MKKVYPGNVLCILVFILICIPSLSFGSGFGVFTQGASALGQGSAVVAHNDSPSAIFYNPALINGLPGTQVEIGTTLLFPDREFKSDLTGKKYETEDNVFYPSTFYFTHAFNPSISAGLGLFNPFGLGTTWPEDWEGRYIATKSELTTYNINPVVSWRVTPKFTIAAGVDFIYLDSTLESKVPSAAMGIPGPSFDVKQKFEGDGDGIGYNLGLLLNLTDAVSLGISYRSEVKVDIDGDLSLSITDDKTSGKTSMTLPQQVFAGIAYKPTDKLVLEMGMRWEDWSSFDQLKIDISGQSPAVYPRDWHGTFAFNVGGKYRINNMAAITAGYLYGKNPIPDSNFEPAIPDSDVHLFCLGAEAQFGNFGIALAYAYQLQEEREKSTNHYGAIANGKYDTHIHILGLSLNYRL